MDLWLEKAFLWLLLFFGFFLVIFGLRKPPRKDLLLVFMFTGYCSSIIRVIVVEEHMITYPVGLFEQYFHTSPLYEFLLLPAVSIYYYKTTYHLSWKGIIIQGLAYSAILTIAEATLEKYTDYVNYITWTWQDSFISIFFILFLIRAVVRLIILKET